MQQLPADPAFGLRRTRNRNGEHLAAAGTAGQGLRGVGRRDDWHARDPATLCQRVRQRCGRHASSVPQTRPQHPIQGEYRTGAEAEAGDSPMSRSRERAQKKNANNGENIN